jgi:hypothetical protein
LILRTKDARFPPVLKTIYLEVKSVKTLPDLSLGSSNSASDRSFHASALANPRRDAGPVEVFEQWNQVLTGDTEQFPKVGGPQILAAGESLADLLNRLFEGRWVHPAVPGQRNEAVASLKVVQQVVQVRAGGERVWNLIAGGRSQAGLEEERLDAGRRLLLCGIERRHERGIAQHGTVSSDGFGFHQALDHGIDEGRMRVRRQHLPERLARDARSERLAFVKAGHGCADDIGRLRDEGSAAKSALCAVSIDRSRSVTSSTSPDERRVRGTPRGAILVWGSVRLMLRIVS